MIDHPTDISKDCHQTSQIFAQVAVVLNLTGQNGPQNGRHFCGLRSPCWQRWTEALNKCFDSSTDDQITGLKLENYYFFTFTFSRPEVRKLLLFLLFLDLKLENYPVFTFLLFLDLKLENYSVFTFLLFLDLKLENYSVFTFLLFLDLKLENYSIFRWRSAILQ